MFKGISLSFVAFPQLVGEEAKLAEGQKIIIVAARLVVVARGRSRLLMVERRRRRLRFALRLRSGPHHRLLRFWPFPSAMDHFLLRKTKSNLKLTFLTLNKKTIIFLTRICDCEG